MSARQCAYSTGVYNTRVYSTRVIRWAQLHGQATLHTADLQSHHRSNGAVMRGISSESYGAARAAESVTAAPTATTEKSTAVIRAASVTSATAPKRATAAACWCSQAVCKRRPSQSCKGHLQLQSPTVAAQGCSPDYSPNEDERAALQTREL